MQGATSAASWNSDLNLASLSPAYEDGNMGAASKLEWPRMLTWHGL